MKTVVDTLLSSLSGGFMNSRVSRDLLPSANYIQKSMCVYILSDLLYNICDVYIDDMLIMGSDDDNLITNVRTIVQICRAKKSL